MDSYVVRPRKDRRGVDLISDRLSHGLLWYGEPNAASNAVSFARWHSRVNGGTIEVLNEAGEVIQAEEFQAGRFAY